MKAEGKPPIASPRSEVEIYSSPLSRFGETVTAVTYARSDLAAMYLPVGQMLQIDRVLSVGGNEIVCEMDLGTGHWVFPLHFPGDPIFPGCLLVEAAGQVVAIWGWHAGLRGRPRMAKVTASFECAVAEADGPLTLKASVKLRKNICFGSVAISARGRPVATVEPTLVIVKGENGR